MINVSIKELPARRLAVIEHYGDPKKVGETASKLIAWTKAQPVNLKPKPVKLLVLGMVIQRKFQQKNFALTLRLPFRKH